MSLFGRPVRFSGIISVQAHVIFEPIGAVMRRYVLHRATFSIFHDAMNT